MPRTFKTKGFARDQRKAGIADAELCEAIAQVAKGQCDDLGGGVFKKRLNNNEHRGIILAKSGTHWVYAYLFAKKDRENIEEDELKAFRKLAASYASLDPTKLDALLKSKDLVEICND